jgi:hypothetical protein
MKALYDAAYAKAGGKPDVAMPPSSDGKMPELTGENEHKAPTASPTVAQDTQPAPAPAGAQGKPTATVPIEKFEGYIFKDNADHGKDAVFRGLGYGKEQSADLAKLWQEQGAAKYADGKYTLGKKDQYGQRIDIEIEVPGIGDAVGKTAYMKSGWMIQPDNTIKLNTPFAGFTRSKA